MITLNGLRHCDSCRKAIAWLEGHGVSWQLTYYREHPIASDAVQAYAAKIGWMRLVNRASVTWRGLPATDRSPRSDADWLALVQAYPTLIRRPLLVSNDGTIISGFSADQYAATLGARNAEDASVP